MPSINEIIAMRQRRRSQQQRDPGIRLGLSCSLLLSLIAALALIATAIIYTNLVQGLPSLEVLPVLLNPTSGQLLQPTRIYDRSGEHILLTLQDPGAQESQYLLLPSGLDQAGLQSTGYPAQGSRTGADLLPSGLISATIASVEPGFWSSRGFSLAGIVSGSHPTIAQKVVSDLLLWDEPDSVRRALRERLLAAQITTHFGKSQIMEWYLNSASYGHLIFGADAAARVYFGKSAAELSLAESAWLAAIAQSPLILPEADQQVKIVQAMLDQGLIDAEQADLVKNAQVTFRETVQKPSHPAPAFTRYVLAELDRVIDRTRLERGGLRVITSLDYNLQIQAACVVNAQMARIGSQSADPNGETDCPAARLLPTLAFNLDTNTDHLSASITILDPQTGEILALVGEPDQEPGHSPGSMLTPYIYLTAFTRGLSPASLLWDIPVSVDLPSYQNFDGRYHGPIRLRSALANDYIVPAMQLFERLGPDNVLRTASQLGLATLDREGFSEEAASLEDGQVTLLDLTRSYGIFADQGSISGRPADLPGRGPLAAATGTPNGAGSQAANLAPIATLNMQDTGGQVWLDWQASQSRPVITPQLAYLLTNVLSDEAARWPSLGHPNALEIGRTAAAKLGRALQGSDTWTIGYTPQLVAGVWVGPSSQSPAAGATQPALDPAIAAGIWHAIMQYAHQNLPSENWPQPAGLTTMEVCDPSGMLPTAVCPSVVSEVFLTGSEPTQPDNLYRAIQINRETGRLATVFTPAAAIVEKVFMMAPPEAQAWAENAGIETPPETYDVIADSAEPSQDAHIDAPAMFAAIGGRVAITGYATGDRFAYYRVQIGKGLNPQSWFQVGDDVDRPVEGGTLTNWDTSDLSGLYAVQLLVVHTDQRVESDVIQVTIDNQPPEASIIYPADGQELAEEQITFQAIASDNLNLKEVSFYIDDQLISSLTQAPFAAVWRTTVGQHQLRLEATDLGGNTTQTEIQFTVMR